ncbi:MAG TPA: hypothetical protein VK914_05730 [bacterium]|nr:hypothetical protein [bacterium]
MNPLPKFLTLDPVLALHKLQIEQFGGILGVKDEGMLLFRLLRNLSQVSEINIFTRPL